MLDALLEQHLPGQDPCTFFQARGTTLITGGKASSSVMIDSVYPGHCQKAAHTTCALVVAIVSRNGCFLPHRRPLPSLTLTLTFGNGESRRDH